MILRLPKQDKPSGRTPGASPQKSEPPKRTFWAAYAAALYTSSLRTFDEILAEIQSREEETFFADLTGYAVMDSGCAKAMGGTESVKRHAAMLKEKFGLTPITDHAAPKTNFRFGDDQVRSSIAEAAVPTRCRHVGV